MSVKDARNADVVGAVRMALAGASDEATALRVIVKLCDFAPETTGEATAPTQLLLDALRELKGNLVVVPAPSETPREERQT